MEKIRRYDINEEWAHSGMIQSGGFCFLNYCVRNTGGTIEEQIEGAFDEMDERLALAGLTLENVVQMSGGCHSLRVAVLLTPLQVPGSSFPCLAPTINPAAYKSRFPSGCHCTPVFHKTLIPCTAKLHFSETAECPAA